MREHLLEWIDSLKSQMAECVHHEAKFDCQQTIDRIEAILASNPEPTVRLRPGWVTKDWTGVCWWDNRPQWWEDSPEVRKHFFIHGSLHGRTVNCTFTITDPWPDKPNGGPECLMETTP